MFEKKCPEAKDLFFLMIELEGIETVLQYKNVCKKQGGNNEILGFVSKKKNKISKNLKV